MTNHDKQQLQTNGTDREKGINTLPLLITVIVIGIFAVVVLGAVVWFAWHAFFPANDAFFPNVPSIYFDHYFNNMRSSWGTFGDFVGGLTNPIMALLGLLALLFTLHQNQRALQQNWVEMREAVKAQVERNTIEKVSIHLRVLEAACEALYFNKIEPILSQTCPEDGQRLDAKIARWAADPVSGRDYKSQLNGIDQDIKVLDDLLRALRSEEEELAKCTPTKEKTDTKEKEVHTLMYKKLLTELVCNLVKIGAIEAEEVQILSRSTHIVTDPDATAS